MERFFKNLPLRSKIALFTSLMVGISLVTLTVITSVQERSSSEKELEEQAGILLGTLPYSIRDELYFVALDELKDVAAKIGESENVERFVIYDSTGIILADSSKMDETLESSLGSLEDPDPFGETLIALAPDEEYNLWQREENQFVAGRAIHLNSQLLGAVSITISTNALDKKISTLIFQSTMLAFVVILAGVILSFILSRQISNPLRELMKISREMANGSTELRVDVDAEDEIGQLGLAFNDMTEAIQTRERALQELNASLEEKVEERTEELRHRSEELQELTEELRQRNEELVKMAISDPLTKIYNRRYFFELASKELEVAKKEREPLTAVLADVDHFKQANDSYGHHIGDEILKNLARFLVGNVRGIDVVARYGGEEFVILMPKISGKEAYELIEELRSKIEKTPLVVGRYIILTVSFGIACLDDDENISFESLLYRADQALYRAKDLGRNRVSLWKKNTFNYR